MKRILSFILCVILVMCFAGCKSNETPTDLWKDEATYTEDTTLGSGDKTITFAVTAAEKTVTFTVKTDREFLGDALIDCGLISGEEGQFGIYVDSVNGIIADYKVDHSYWAFTQGGEYMNVGVDGAEIHGGEKFEATYTK